MDFPVNSKTSGGSELIKSGPGELFGFQATSGSPLSGAPTVASTIAFFDSLSAVGLISQRMLAHARVPAAESYAWEPSVSHAFARGLWLQVYSGSPVVTTSYS